MRVDQSFPNRLAKRKGDVHPYKRATLSGAAGSQKRRINKSSGRKDIHTKSYAIVIAISHSIIMPPKNRAIMRFVGVAAIDFWDHSLDSDCGSSHPFD